MNINFKLLDSNAKLPAQKLGDTGFDITSIENLIILPRSTAKIPTGLALAKAIPPLAVAGIIRAQPFLKIEGRSGLSALGIFPTGGIVDNNYRGEIQVVLNNISDRPYEIHIGDRIAQFVIYYALSNIEAGLEVRCVESADLEDSERGTKGFGSSGR